MHVHVDLGEIDHRELYSHTTKSPSRLTAAEKSIEIWILGFKAIFCRNIIVFSQLSTDFKKQYLDDVHKESVIFYKISDKAIT